MAAHVDAHDFPPWTLSDDPKADTELVLEDGTCLHIRRAVLELCKSPVFDALSPDEHEIHVIGFTRKQIDLFLKHIHPNFQVRATGPVILSVMPVAHFYGVDSIMNAFIEVLAVEGKKDPVHWAKPAILAEQLRTRTEGECPWPDELLRCMWSYELQMASGVCSRRYNPSEWLKLKPETQIAMVQAALRYWPG